MKNISVIIPIYNRIQTTQEGLLKLEASLKYCNSKGNGNLKIEIVVVDDGSTDGSSEWIKNNFPQIHRVYGDGNLWWSGSINKGIKFAKNQLDPDYILLWNDDTFCQDDYFVNLEQYIENPRFENAILVSKVLWENSEELIFNYGCTFNAVTGKKKLIGANEYDTGQYEMPIKIDWSGGMGTLIPSSVFDKVGYFDQDTFPQYYGDADFFLRAKDNSIPAYAIPGLKLYNKLDSSGIKMNGNFNLFVKSLFSIRSNYNIKTTATFYKRHSNSPLAFLYLGYMYVHYVGSFLKLKTKSLIHGKTH